jgi:hypothetical protein
VSSLPRLIQALIILSVLIGVLFLYQVQGLVPAEVFAFVAVGWVLFVVDSVLTFLRPRLSYYLAFVLAVLALASSLPETAHYTFIEQGDVVPALIFIVGSAAQILLVVLVPYYFVSARRPGVEHGVVQG